MNRGSTMESCRSVRNFFLSDSSSGENFMSECLGSNDGSSIENCPNVRDFFADTGALVLL